MRLFVICCAWLGVSALVPAVAWAPWGTGEGMLPAWSVEQVCRNGMTWQFATVTRPVPEPDRPTGRPPQSITRSNVVVREDGSADALAGPIELTVPLQPFYVDPESVGGEVSELEWIPGYPGLFTHHAVQTLQFNHPVSAQTRIELSWDEPGVQATPINPAGTAIGFLGAVTTCHLIDLEPVEFPNEVRPGVGAVHVAVLSTPGFKAKTIRSHTVRFGTGGERAAPRDDDLVDVDGDNDSDLLLRFRTRDTGIACDSHAVKLEAKRENGKTLNGEDSVMPVGC